MSDGRLPAVTRTTYGLLRLGSAAVALPLSILREVVPRPERYEPLPVATPGLRGAVTVRGQIVPVIDLAALSGAEPVTGADHVVAVLQGTKRVLGVVADAVVGVEQAADDDLQRVDTPPSAERVRPFPSLVR